jgi:hypothetical protein
LLHIFASERNAEQTQEWLGQVSVLLHKVAAASSQVESNLESTLELLTDLKGCSYDSLDRPNEQMLLEQLYEDFTCSWRNVTKSRAFPKREFTRLLNYRGMKIEQDRQAEQEKLVQERYLEDCDIALARDQSRKQLAKDVELQKQVRKKQIEDEDARIAALQKKEDEIRCEQKKSRAQRRFDEDLACSNKYDVQIQEEKQRHSPAKSQKNSKPDE